MAPKKKPFKKWKTILNPIYRRLQGVKICIPPSVFNEPAIADGHWGNIVGADKQRARTMLVRLDQDRKTRYFFPLHDVIGWVTDKQALKKIPYDLALQLYYAYGIKITEALDKPSESEDGSHARSSKTGAADVPSHRDIEVARSLLLLRRACQRPKALKRRHDNRSAVPLWAAQVNRAELADIAAKQGLGSPAEQEALLALTRHAASVEPGGQGKAQQQRLEEGDQDGKRSVRPRLQQGFPPAGELAPSAPFAPVQWGHAESMHAAAEHLALASTGLHVDLGLLARHLPLLQECVAHAGDPQAQLLANGIAQLCVKDRQARLGLPQWPSASRPSFGCGPSGPERAGVLEMPRHAAGDKGRDISQAEAQLRARLDIIHEGGDCPSGAGPSARAEQPIWQAGLLDAPRQDGPPSSEGGRAGPVLGAPTSFNGEQRRGHGEVPASLGPLSLGLVSRAPGLAQSVCGSTRQMLLASAMCPPPGIASVAPGTIPLPAIPLGNKLSSQASQQVSKDPWGKYGQFGAVTQQGLTKIGSVGGQGRPERPAQQLEGQPRASSPLSDSPILSRLLQKRSVQPGGLQGLAAGQVGTKGIFANPVLYNVPLGGGGGGGDVSHGHPTLQPGSLQGPATSGRPSGVSVTAGRALSELLSEQSVTVAYERAFGRQNLQELKAQASKEGGNHGSIAMASFHHALCSQPLRVEGAQQTISADVRAREDSAERRQLRDFIAQLNTVAASSQQFSSPALDGPPASISRVGLGAGATCAQTSPKSQIQANLGPAVNKSQQNLRALLAKGPVQQNQNKGNLQALQCRKTLAESAGAGQEVAASSLPHVSTEDVQERLRQMVLSLQLFSAGPQQQVQVEQFSLPQRQVLMSLSSEGSKPPQQHQSSQVQQLLDRLAADARTQLTPTLTSLQFREPKLPTSVASPNLLSISTQTVSADAQLSQVLQSNLAPLICGPRASSQEPKRGAPISNARSSPAVDVTAALDRVEQLLRGMENKSPVGAMQELLKQVCNGSGRTQGTKKDEGGKQGQATTMQQQPFQQGPPQQVQQPHHPLRVVQAQLSQAHHNVQLSRQQGQQQQPEVAQVVQSTALSAKNLFHDDRKRAMDILHARGLKVADVAERPAAGEGPSGAEITAPPISAAPQRVVLNDIVGVGNAEQPGRPSVVQQIRERYTALFRSESAMLRNSSALAASQGLPPSNAQEAANRKLFPQAGSNPHAELLEQLLRHRQPSQLAPQVVTQELSNLSAGSRVRSVSQADVRDLLRQSRVQPQQQGYQVEESHDQGPREGAQHRASAQPPSHRGARDDFFTRRPHLQVGLAQGYKLDAHNHRQGAAMQRAQR